MPAEGGWSPRLSEGAPPCSLRLAFPGDAVSVREGLRRLLAAPPLCDLPADTRETAEIVLAEALNNIVEHAYARYAGQIEVTLNKIGPVIHCQIADRGQPMPGAVLPHGLLAPLDPARPLPEGGFGWYLIRTLAHEVTYRRDGGKNLLSFRINAT